MNSSNDSEGADSAIFQAVLTHSSDVVKTVIDSRLTNRALVKAAFNLALKRRLDEILGLLLKALGLDRNKGSLNIGGLGLCVLKPLWLYPSLGVSNTGGRYRAHRRVGSLDYVLSGLIRRSSTGVSPDKEQLEKGGANTEDGASGEGVASEGGAALSESVGVAPVRPSEAEDAHKFIKSWDASRFDDYYTLSAPPPSRFLQKRLKMVASKPPSLPTVVCSPIAAVKEKPLENSPTDNLLLSDNNRFVGSYLEGDEIEVSNGISKEEVDGDRRDSIASRDEDASGRVPQRRHANVTKTTTGASYMPFSTLDLFHQQGLTNLPHSSGSRSSRISADFADADIFSPGHVRRAVLKNQLLKRKATPPPGGFSSSQSRSTSPYLSSDEVALGGGGGGGRVTYSALLDSITTTPREKRTELLSSLISSNEEGVDEPDGGGTPGALSIATVAMTTPFSTATPSRLSSMFFIKSLDISANRLETVETLVNDPLPSRLRELLYVDMKQNKLTELPQLLFQVSVMYNTVVIAW